MKIMGKSNSSVQMKFSHVQVAVRLVGEGLEGKQKGKTVYSMHDYVDVGDAKPEEVFSVIVRAIEAASQKR